MTQTYLYWSVTFLAEPSANRWRSMFPVRTPCRKTCEFEVVRSQKTQWYLGWNGYEGFLRQTDSESRRCTALANSSLHNYAGLMFTYPEKIWVQYDVGTYSRVRYPRVWSSPRVWRYVNRSLYVGFMLCGFDLRDGLSKGRPSARRVREVL